MRGGGGGERRGGDIKGALAYQGGTVPGKARFSKKLQVKKTGIWILRGLRAQGA